MNKENKWFMYFNPCGAQPVNGFVFKRCFEACQNGKPLCLASCAFQMAGYLLKGSSSPIIERRDYEQLLKENMGKVIVDLNGEPTTLTEENMGELLDKTVSRATDTVNAIHVCEEQTLNITDQYLEGCTDEQKITLNQLMELNNIATIFRGSFEEAQKLADSIRKTLQRAIELDLDELGLVTRQAIGYGLGQQVLAKRGIPSDTIPTTLGKFQKSI